MNTLRKTASVVVVGTICAGAHGVLFTGSNGSYSASADFEIVSGNLQVTLTNTSTADVMVPSDILSAVFFNVAGDPALSRIQAVLGPGSHVWTGTTETSPDPDYTVIGSAWMYTSGISEYSANQGISCAGLNDFGKFDKFYGSSTPGFEPYGLTSAGDNPATGNSKILSTPFINDSAVFTLGSLPVGFDLNSISNVTFQYGTSMGEGDFGGHKGTSSVPGPLAGLPFALGLVVGLRKRITRR